MRRYLTARILQLIPLLWLVMTLVFVLLRLVPGDPATTLLGFDASDTERAALRQRLGLDEPIPIQYVRYLGELARGNLGRSIFYHEDVLGLVLTTAPATLELAGSALLFAVVIAVPLGVVAAIRRGGLTDWISVVVATLGAAVPSFWLGLMLILLFSVSLGVLPSNGRGDPAWSIDGLRHLLLPAVTLALGLIASTTRLTRSAMLDILGEEYLRTARAKGLREAVVIRRHALRNATIPIVTNVGLQAGALLGGALLVETVFAWPGLGRLGVDAMFRRDYPLVQGVVLATVALYAGVNLFIDLLYAAIDPRIRYK